MLMLFMEEIIFIVLGLFLLIFIFLGVFVMSLNSELKAVKETLAKIVGVSEEKVGEIVSNAVKPVRDRAEELAVFTGVDEDKTPPAQPAAPQPVGQ